MVADHLLYDVEDGVATITLNRPEQFNAVTTEMIADLVRLFDRTDEDDDVRAVIVTGSGRAFCAGADLAGGEGAFDFAGGETQGSEDYLHRDSGGMFTLRVLRSVKPVIAAINGHAVGFGASMTLPMDFRVVADDAKLGFVFGSRGIVTDGAASWFLPKIVGLPRALDWCLTGRVFGPNEALEAGLVRSLHPADQVLEAARGIARSIAEGVAPMSAVFMRQLLWQNAGAETPMSAHRVESKALSVTGRGTDAREGVRAFIEKRPPQWSQRFTQDAPSWFPWVDEERFEQ